VLSQFACTSLWFAGNAVITDIIQQYSLGEQALGHLVSAVQFGFILGTLVFAVFNVSDRFSPSKVFFGCALAGALANVGIFAASGFVSIMLVRFGTGFFLAGIYPVGMKIAADYHDHGLGKALGFLVGALVLGTAFPYLLKSLTSAMPWSTVFVFTSGLAVLGGLFMYVGVPDGPFRRQSQPLNYQAFWQIFKEKDFRRAAAGYFGHMWELYTFWAFVPIILTTYRTYHPNINFNLSILSFGVIAGGGVACVGGGYLAEWLGSSRIAFIFLLFSFLLCLTSPLLFHLPVYLFLGCLFLWGMVVVADSPQFSALVAQTAPVAARGTALTMVNCIGFFITIISIQTLNNLANYVAPGNLYVFLGIGPFLGLLSLFKLILRKTGHQV